jgi:hypothetical protein
VPDQPDKEDAAAPKSDPNADNAKSASETVKLSPEEQMALYEEELKETDWGHQPC